LVVRNFNNTSGNNTTSEKKIKRKLGFFFPSVIWGHGLSPVPIPMASLWPWDARV